MNILPTADIAWDPAYRIIRTIYPPVWLFEDISDAADWDLIASAEAKTNPRVLFFDQNGMYCEAGKCSMVRDGKPLARDYGHITESGAEVLQSYFTAWARANVPEIFDAPAAPSR